MFNPIEPRVDQPSGRIRRRPSLGRIFFWSYLLGIPVVAVGAGVALLIASNQLDAAVQTYRSAVPCSASTSTACYTLVPGTLVKFTITRGKTGSTADMTLRLPDGTRSTWAKTNGQQEDALRVGAPIRAEFYQGAITTVYLGAIGIQTKDSPVYKQSDMRLGAVLIPVLGLIIAAASFFTLRGQKQVTVGSLMAIDPTLPIAQQEALVRHALLQDRPPLVGVSGRRRDRGALAAAASADSIVDWAARARDHGVRNARRRVPPLALPERTQAGRGRSQRAPGESLWGRARRFRERHHSSGMSDHHELRHAGSGAASSVAGWHWSVPFGSPALLPDGGRDGPARGCLARAARREAGNASHGLLPAPAGDPGRGQLAGGPPLACLVRSVCPNFRRDMSLRLVAQRLQVAPPRSE